MAYVLTRSGDRAERGSLREIRMDSAADLPDLPGLESCSPGSNALDMETGDIYFLRSDGVWALMGG